ncbi:hypothetical protein ENBRE01_1315 [Enteropsectra breve]|nr:hypothetical protein ENBRE01_1315 [Enteropsectra breve]
MSKVLHWLAFQGFMLWVGASLMGSIYQRPFSERFSLLVYGTDGLTIMDIRDLYTIKVFREKIELDIKSYDAKTGKTLENIVEAVAWYRKAEEVACAGLDKDIDEYVSDIREYFYKKTSVVPNRITQFLDRPVKKTPLITLNTGKIVTSHLAYIFCIRTTLYLYFFKKDFCRAQALEVLNVCRILDLDTKSFSQICIRSGGKYLHRKINSQLLFCINFIILLGETGLLADYKQAALLCDEENELYLLIHDVALMEEALANITVKNKGCEIYGIYLHKNYGMSENLASVIREGDMKIQQAKPTDENHSDEEYYVFTEFESNTSQESLETGK